MLGSLGMPELLFILVLALLVFGPKRLPQVGRTLGKGLREFRRATNELKRTVDSEISVLDSEPIQSVPAAERPTRVKTVPIEPDSPEAEALAAAELEVEPAKEAETTKGAAPVAVAAPKAGSAAEITASADAE